MREGGEGQAEIASVALGKLRRQSSGLISCPATMPPMPRSDVTRAD